MSPLFVRGVGNGIVSVLVALEDMEEAYLWAALRRSRSGSPAAALSRSVARTGTWSVSLLASGGGKADHGSSFPGTAGGTEAYGLRKAYHCLGPGS